MNEPLRVKESDNENLRLGYQKQVLTLTLLILMSFCFILNKEILLVFHSILFFLFFFSIMARIYQFQMKIKLSGRTASGSHMQFHC